MLLNNNDNPDIGTLSSSQSTFHPLSHLVAVQAGRRAGQGSALLSTVGTLKPSEVVCLKLCAQQRTRRQELEVRVLTLAFKSC